MNIQDIKKSLTSQLISKLAIEALFSERKSQEKSWNPETTSSGGQHNELEFLVFMQDYLRDAINIVSHQSEPTASNKAAHNLRKITAMAMSCAEKNGWVTDLIEKYDNSVVENDTNLVMSLGLIQHYINKGFESAATGFPESTKMYVGLIFWTGMHIMSKQNSFAPPR